MRVLTFGVVCLGVSRVAPDVEDSASFEDCECPKVVGDGGGIEDGGRDGDLETDCEFPEWEIAACEVGALSIALPGGVGNQLSSVSRTLLRFLALLVSTPSKRSDSDETGTKYALAIGQT